VGEGHELASHGMNHTRIWAQSSHEFRKDVAASKKLLEDVGGVKVRGYRAASWSLDERTPWAHEIIAEAGYDYSSSLYPVRHDHYGMPDAPATPFYPVSGDLLEIPASTTHVLGRNWPAAGGGYFRLFPLQTSLWMIRRINRTTGFPALFYFHPWELDPDQPRMSGASAKSRFRHYLNLHKFENRLRTLLSEFEWGRIDDIYLPKTGQ
jgi:polysaccharide deacetylase family protein (PEP-CTERM system associated)